MFLYTIGQIVHKLRIDSLAVHLVATVCDKESVAMQYSSQICQSFLWSVF